MNSEADKLELVDIVAKKRGCIIRGGEIDYERVSKLIVGDFRKGDLGHITFD